MQLVELFVQLMCRGTEAVLESLAAVLSSQTHLTLPGPDQPVSVFIDRIE